MSDPIQPETAPDIRATILVVDDERIITGMLKRILEPNNYRVLVANDGHEALGQLVGADPPVDLLVTDISMEPMDGCELASHVTCKYPDVGILLMSGCIKETPPEQFIHFLPKPFTPNQFLQAINEVFTNKQRSKP